TGCCFGRWASSFDARGGRVTGVPTLHAPGGVYGNANSAGAIGWKSRGDPTMAAQDGSEEDVGEPAGSAGDDRDQRRRSGDSGGVARIWRFGRSLKGSVLPDGPTSRGAAISSRVYRVSH